ncbi:gluconokinase [Microbacterium sp. A93]|uniref:gluconokinase n=1 Tax=Microbacterium sp. A93 TaxID=3450716 RepID=UPI003F422631
MTDENAPLICVMGVSAAGKTTVGIALAEQLGVPFNDADALHSDANRAKMASGTPLTDDDRWPWLETVGDRFRSRSDTGLVMACSALRRVYRDRIRSVAPDVLFVHLHGSRELLLERAQARTDHFMPAALFDSQLATLEVLDEDEAGFVVIVDREPHELVEEIVGRLAKSSVR